MMISREKDLPEWKKPWKAKRVVNTETSEFFWHLFFSSIFGFLGFGFWVLMAVEFNSLLYSYNLLSRRNKPFSFPFPSSRFKPTSYTPIHFSHNKLNLSKNRLSASALISEENAVGSSFSSTDMFKLTYYEGNSWLWDVNGLKILVDPILVGNLDFGIPWLYDAAKKFLKKFQLSDLPEIDCLLITQSLDDHCHLKTLKPFSKMFPNLPVIATPNAKALLSPLFSNVTYLEPGESSEINGKNGSNVRVKATAGPVLGPPWQRPENGYLVGSQQGQLTLYYEPHCVYNQEFLQKERADIVITPVIKQLLPKFTLVSGQEDAVRLAKLLQAKFIVPMQNGDLESKGFLSSIIQREGTMESFKELLSKELPGAQVLEPTPGIPLEIPTPSNNP